RMLHLDWPGLSLKFGREPSVKPWGRRQSLLSLARATIRVGGDLTESSHSMNRGGGTMVAYPAARFFRIIASTLLLLAAPVLGNAQSAQASGVTVNGVGTAYGAPDTAVLDLGVSLYHSDVAEGMAQVDQRMQAIREALIAAGV